VDRARSCGGVVSVAAVADLLERYLGRGAVARDLPVAELTTYRLGGPFAVVVRVRDQDALTTVARVLRDQGRDLPVLVVGRGSNLLVADAGVDGVALVLEGEFEKVALDAEHGIVRAGGAVPLPVLARRAAAAGLAGLEFYVGIPGSVGGAIRMNAGGHGSETADVLLRAWIADLDQDAQPMECDSPAIDLGYRHSAIAARDVVTAAEFSVYADSPEACEARIGEIVRWRREHQPGGSNAGSVFRNPPGDSAGRLIDASGCKGVRIGGAVVSEKHANFFQAEPGATAADVRALVCEVQRRVVAATGVRLVPELRMIGFPAHDAVHQSEGGAEEGPP
jgi:UDP-N-acetylmuramate dehydrogenase